MLHDLGNPPHLFANAILEYIHKVESVGEMLIPYTRSSINFFNIANLIRRNNKENNSYKLIQDRLNTWEIPIEIKTEFDKGLRKGKIEHGVFSALLMLRTIDGLYAINNPEHYETDEEIEANYGYNRVGWGREHFDSEVVDAAAAISIHNLITNLIGEIEYNCATLPFLLILSDTIQEWDRYSPGQRVYDPFSISFYFLDNIPSLHFRLSQDKITKIKRILEKLRINGTAIIIE